MSAHLIVAEAARHFMLTYEQVQSHSRHGPLMMPRIAATMAMRRRGFSLPRIAKLLNRNCHSTAINHLEKTHLLRDPDFAALVDRLATMDIAPDPKTISIGRPRKDHVAWTVRAVRPLPKKPKAKLTPRQLVRAGQIDRAQFDEFTARDGMERGSRMLAEAIASQFRFGSAAA